MAGNYNECAQLSAVIVKANTNAREPEHPRGDVPPRQVHPDRRAGHLRLQRLDSVGSTGDTVALKYSNGVPGLDSVVKFRWNGSGVELIGNTPRLTFRTPAAAGAERRACPTVAHVFVVDDRVIYSASDLAAAARCEYALLRAFDAKLGRGPAGRRATTNCSPAPPQLGDEHEQRHLDDCCASSPTDEVAVIGRPGLHRRRA